MSTWNRRRVDIVINSNIPNNLCITSYFANNKLIDYF